MDLNSSTFSKSRAIEIKLPGEVACDESEVRGAESREEEREPPLPRSSPVAADDCATLVSHSFAVLRYRNPLTRRPYRKNESTTADATPP